MFFELVVSHRFGLEEVNSTFMSVEALSSTRPGSLLLLIASKSKKTFSTLIISCLYQFNNYTKTTRVFRLSGVKLRMLGAGGLSWGSTS